MRKPRVDDGFWRLLIRMEGGRASRAKFACALIDSSRGLCSGTRIHSSWLRSGLADFRSARVLTKRLMAAVVKRKLNKLLPSRIVPPCARRPPEELAIKPRIQGHAHLNQIKPAPTAPSKLPIGPAQRTWLSR